MPGPRWLVALALALALAGCGELERLRAGIEGSPHEQYAAALRSAGLAEAALGADWLAAAEGALRAPVASALPLQEVAYFDPAAPSAVAYRFEVRRGERFLASVRREPGDTARVFVDLFAASEGEPRRVRGTVTRADSVSLAYEPSRDGALLLRVQPEALRGGRVTLTVETAPTLAFPVAGADARAVRSFFGDPRDGGRRRHEGVDVFAPRGTPVLAPAAGTVTRVTEGGLGGKVVWLRPDGRALGLYYAHLDEQLVTPGQRVALGDTLGTVGNTGNARNTPPHLHFGVYASGSGAVDPMPFIDGRRPALPAVRVSGEALGTWVRTRAAGVRLGEEGATLPAGSALRVVGAAADGYRVEGPEGALGYVPARQVEPAEGGAVRPLRGGQALRAQPRASAAALDSLPPGTGVRELGRSGAFRLVEAGERRGWVSEE